MDEVIATFKSDMDKVIEHLNTGFSSHKYIQCQILLVQFMKDVLANTNEKLIIENLDAWEEKCEDRVDLVQAFSKWVCSVQPHFLQRMGCDYTQTVLIQKVDDYNLHVNNIFLKL